MAMDSSHKSVQIDDREHFGLIAQEVEAVYLDMVYTDDEGMKGICTMSPLGWL